MSTTLSVSTEPYRVFGYELPAHEARRALDEYTSHPERSVAGVLRGVGLGVSTANPLDRELAQWRAAGHTRFAETSVWFDELQRQVTLRAETGPYDVFGYLVPRDRAIDLLNHLGVDPRGLGSHLRALGLPDTGGNSTFDRAAALAAAPDGVNGAARRRAVAFTWNLFAQVFPDEVATAERILNEAEIVETPPLETAAGSDALPITGPRTAPYRVFNYDVPVQYAERILNEAGPACGNRYLSDVLHAVNPDLREDDFILRGIAGPEAWHKASVAAGDTAHGGVGTETWIWELFRQVYESDPSAVDTRVETNDNTLPAGHPETYAVFGYAVHSDTAIALLNAFGPTPERDYTRYFEQVGITAHAIQLPREEASVGWDAWGEASAKWRAERADSVTTPLPRATRREFLSIAFAWELFVQVFGGSVFGEAEVDVETDVSAATVADLIVYGVTIPADKVDAMLEAFVDISGDHDGPSLQNRYWRALGEDHPPNDPEGIDWGAMEEHAHSVDGHFRRTAGYFGDELRRVHELQLQATTPTEYVVYGYSVPADRAQDVLDEFRDNGRRPTNVVLRNVGLPERTGLTDPSNRENGWRSDANAANRSDRDQWFAKLEELMHPKVSADPAAPVAPEGFDHTIPEGSLLDFKRAIHAKLRELGRYDRWCDYGQQVSLEEIGIQVNPTTLEFIEPDETEEKIALARRLIEVAHGDRGRSVLTKDRIAKALSEIGVTPAQLPETKHYVDMTVRVPVAARDIAHALTQVADTGGWLDVNGETREVVSRTATIAADTIAVTTEPF